MRMSALRISPVRGSTSEGPIAYVKALLAIQRTVL